MLMLLTARPAQAAVVRSAATTLPAGLVVTGPNGMPLMAQVVAVVAVHLMGHPRRQTVGMVDCMVGLAAHLAMGALPLAAMARKALS